MQENPNLIPLQMARQLFLNSTSVLEEADSGFFPKEGMYSVAQQVEHTALTVLWFANAVKGEGFNMDFETFEKKCRAATSYDESMAHFNAAFDKAEEIFGGLSQEEIMAPLPDNPIMGPVPIFSLLFSIQDHTAHHRGSLVVYARLLGKQPKMPYSEM